MNFVAIDFETANAKRSSVCSMGIAVVQEGLIVDQAYWLIKPKELYFNPFNISIHGISESDVMCEPEFNELWPQINSYLENRYVLAHNASFDLNVLRNVLDEYALPYPTLNYTCSWMVSKKHWPDLLSHKLNALSQYLGIRFKHHNALEDAVACAKIMIQICKEQETDSIKHLASKLGIPVGGIFPGGYTPAVQSKAKKRVKL